MSAEATTNGEAWTLARLLSWTTEFLAGRGVEEPRLAAEVLLARAAECRRIDLYARFEQTLEPEPLDAFRASVRRAAEHEPIAYLVGEKEFFSLAMTVTPDVLIPRPETERLVECVLDHCKQAGLTKPRLADIGTGSGCIVIAVLAHIEGATAVATDISAAALAVARANAERHGVLDRLTLAEADGLSLAESVVPDGGFDVLMSNPPYVAASETADLPPTVRDHEPRVALTDEADGLTFFRAIGSDAPALLAPDGCVLVEVGDGQADAAIQVVVASQGLRHVGTWKDRTVGQDRVLMFSPS